MFRGTLEAIFIGPAKGEPMQAVGAAEALSGAGLVGDRYACGAGTFSHDPDARPERPSRRPGEAGVPQTLPDRQVTLIEAEALEGAAQEGGPAIEPSESRRNLLVRGVPLNHLVGREFLVGSVRLRGLRLCEPCGRLQKLTVPGIKTALLHRGGLRAEILDGGELRIGAAVVPAT